MHYTPSGGWIELVCGSMFSGKTEELLRRVRRAEIARKKVQLFKPTIDNRYGLVRVASHDGVARQADVERAMVDGDLRVHPRRRGRDRAQQHMAVVRG